MCHDIATVISSILIIGGCILFIATIWMDYDKRR